MKRTLIAALVAAAFATPAGAAPTTLVEDLLASAFAAIDEPILVERNAILLAADETAKAQAEAMRRWGEEFSHELHTNLTTMYGPRLVSGRVVKGAPYSAEVITEANQALADGNVISKKTQGAVYRDGEGRTRQESSGEGKKNAAVYINDPVGAKYIVLMPDSKSAVVRQRGTPVAMNHEHFTRERTKDKTIIRQDGTEIRIENGVVTINGTEMKSGNGRLTVDGKDIRIENGKVFINGKEVAVTVTQPNVVVKTIEDGDGTRREEIRVQVIRNGDERITTIPIPPTPPIPPVAAVPPIPPLPPMPGVQTLRFESTAKLGKGVTTQLGTKDFDGVKAEGKSTVWTIAAGEIGNRNAINVTSETWYSPDLKVTVYSRYADPRTGESIYRLANIRRGEPVAALFTVPADYTEKGRKEKDKAEKDKK